MSGITRRNLMRNSALTATASLLPTGLAARASPTPASTPDPALNVFHVFAFQWKPEAPDAQKEKATHDIRAFQGTIPGLLETHVGPNISPRGKGYTFGGIMRFQDQAALDAYVKHPSHQALLVWLVPLIDAIELDLHA